MINDAAGEIGGKREKLRSWRAFPKGDFEIKGGCIAGKLVLGEKLP